MIIKVRKYTLTRMLYIHINLLTYDHKVLFV